MENKTKKEKKTNNDKTKNDVAWEFLFEKYNLLEEIHSKGYVTITAPTIGEVREARLMTKFDYQSQLPQIFIKNHLSILPVTRGSYVIAPFQTFCKFTDENVEIKHIHFPVSLESINYKNITSEATAINSAFVSNILHDFTGEKHLFPTVSGRMSSSDFSFYIDLPQRKTHIQVKNAQIEIDGGYEGENGLYLIEAKNDISDDFIIRQLYYPFRLWSTKINKVVRPIFMTYSNGIFHLREYVFEDPEHYNSIKLVRYKKYSLQEGTITIQTIRQILNNIKVVSEPEVPFPQANNFKRVINMQELLIQNDFLTKEEIELNYDFNSKKRQADYYINAGKYLGIMEQVREDMKIGCKLTENGVRIFNNSILNRQLEFVKLILSHKPFKEVLEWYFDKKSMPTEKQVAGIMKHCNLYRINSDDTYERRASTVLSWVNWIIDLTRKEQKDLFSDL